MKWLKENWKVILIVLNIPVLVMVSIMFWFYTNAYLIWNPDNFDHIMSPVGGIISAVFVCIAIFQSRKIIAVTVSRNLKPNFDREIDRVIGILQEKRFNDPEDHPISTFELIEVIEGIRIDFSFDEEYLQDLTAYKNGATFKPNYFENRSYYNDLKYLTYYCNHGVPTFRKVVILLEHIKSSALYKDDKAHYFRIVKNEMVEKFMIAMSIEEQNNEFLFPLFSETDVNGNVDFISISKTNYKTYYQYFKSKLNYI